MRNQDFFYNISQFINIKKLKIYSKNTNFETKHVCELDTLTSWQSAASGWMRGRQESVIQYSD